MPIKLSEYLKHPFKLYFLLAAITIFTSLSLINCDSENPLASPPAPGDPALTVADVEQMIIQAVNRANKLGDTISVAVLDREANVLGVFNMTGVDPQFIDSALLGSIAKARTAAYLSSNQHGFTTLTAAYITRPHFPPGVDNTPGGPLYGVPQSSIGGGDVQPNGDLLAGRPATGEQGLTGVPGGIPIFKNNALAGGIGISGGGGLSNFNLDLCQGIINDEIIALGAASGFSVDDGLRGDNIFIDGIRFLFSNGEAESAGPGMTTMAEALTLGTIDVRFPIRATPPAKFPIPFGDVNLGAGFDFRPKAGSILSLAQVQQIINQAVAQADKTRAAIRRPIGSPARVFITVVDIDGTVLGIHRTRDATLFSYDVSAQKARTVVAYSRTDHPLGIDLRVKLGLSAAQPLAMSCRAVGFLAQDFFPPGIDEETLGREIMEGPLFQGQEFQLQKDLGTAPYGNGITIFPGGVPLYINGVLVGGIGVSGDGVDQDDIICFAGSVGFEPPESIRCDQFMFDEVRLPYVKFPRQPELE